MSRCYNQSDVKCLVQGLDLCNFKRLSASVMPVPCVGAMLRPCMVTFTTLSNTLVLGQLSGVAFMLLGLHYCLIWKAGAIETMPQVEWCLVLKPSRWSCNFVCLGINCPPAFHPNTRGADHETALPAKGLQPKAYTIYLLYLEISS